MGGRKWHRSGAMTACLVLVGVSGAAPGTDGPKVREQERVDAAGRVGSVGALGMGVEVSRESGTIENSGDTEDAGAVIPTVYTGDVPATVLAAYRRAHDVMGRERPGCRLPLELLEAIGKVETNHARNGLVDTAGTTVGAIVGPALDGNGFAAIPDTDGGRLDGDAVWDHAVGPMQFLPSTWADWGTDGNEDRNADPDNVYDASLAAARYLCAANRDLGTPEGLDEAISSYNHSASYRNLVLAWMSTYANGTTFVPDATTLTGRPPVRVVAVTVPVNPPGPATPPAAAPSQPPTPAAPTEPLLPAATQPPTTTPPTPGQPSPQPATGPAQGLVCGVTGLVGGLLGGLLGSGGHRHNC